MLKGVTNCILCITRVWSLFCSVRVYIRLYFLPILLVKLCLRLSVFWFFMFLFLWTLLFIFSVLCFEFNIISKDLTRFFSFAITLFKHNDLLKYKNRVITKCFQRALFVKKNAIYKDKFYSVQLYRKIWSCHKIKISLEEAWSEI